KNAARLGAVCSPRRTRDGHRLPDRSCDLAGANPAGCLPLSHGHFLRAAYRPAVGTANLHRTDNGFLNTGHRGNGAILGSTLCLSHRLESWWLRIPSGLVRPDELGTHLCGRRTGMASVAFLPEFVGGSHACHRRWAATAAVAWLGVWLLSGAARPTPQEMRCTFLAVGHGGCTVIETSDGRTLLYDAGAVSGPDVTRRIIAPYLWNRGIRRIDAVFLSHA